MLWMAPLRCMLYLASPLLYSLQELEDHCMHLSDIAPHDATRDLILLNQQWLAEMELSNQLERKKRKAAPALKTPWGGKAEVGEATVCHASQTCGQPAERGQESGGRWIKEKDGWLGEHKMQ